MARDRVWIETTPTRESFLSSPSAGEGERRPTVKNCGRRKNCTVVDLDFRARGRTPPASAQEIDADKKGMCTVLLKHMVVKSLLPLLFLCSSTKVKRSFLVCVFFFFFVYHRQRT